MTFSGVFGSDDDLIAIKVKVGVDRGAVAENDAVVTIVFFDIQTRYAVNRLREKDSILRRINAVGKYRNVLKAIFGSIGIKGVGKARTAALCFPNNRSCFFS